jgi:glyoxylase-like metal-dependent hydrolase (beta-lactamase superfamily II)
MKQILPGLWDIDEIGEAVHCYVWEWEQGLTLIDTGMPGDAAKISKALLKQGWALHNVRRILITHVDMDHTGGLAELQRVTGANVACHVVEKAFMEQPWRRQPAFYLRPLFALFTLFPAFRQQSVTPMELLVDGQELPEGFVVVHTPGHTPGHIALLHKTKRLLVAGDALVNRRHRLRPNESPFTPDPYNARRSVWKLAKKYGDDFETIVFGHGPPILQNGGQRVKALASQLFSGNI